MKKSFIKCPACGFPHEKEVKKCLNCGHWANESIPRKIINTDIFGYRCPICKTINGLNDKYCIQCGHWLLDTIIPAEPLSSDSYKDNIRDYNYKNKNNFDTLKTLLYSIIIIFIIAVISSHFVFNKKPKTNLNTQANSQISNNYNQNNNATNSNRVIETPTPIELSDFHSEIISNISYATGIIKNNYVGILTNLKVDVSFLDERHNEIGSSSDTLSQLNPGSSWKFKVPVNLQGVKRIQIKNLTYDH